MSEASEPQIVIRPARPSDAGAYLKLVEAFAEYERLPPPDPEARTRLIDHLFRDRPYYRLLVAEVDKNIVGYAAHTVAYSTFQARPTLLLEDIFVLPEYRKLRIGHRLFAYCAKTAVADGCGRMDFLVLDWNRVALDFYERHSVACLRNWLLHRLEGEGLHRVAALGPKELGNSNGREG